MSLSDGDLGGVDPQRRLPGDGHPRGGQRAVPGLPVHLGQPRAGQVPALDARGDQGRDHPAHPVAFPGRRRGVDDLLRVPVLMSWQVTAPMTGAANRSHSRRWVWACLRDHRCSAGQPVRVQVMGDQVRAGPLHVRRVGLEPLRDLLQLGGQLLLGRRLALLPLARPRATPPATGPRSSAGRVHGDPEVQLDHLAAAAGGRAAVPLARTGRAPGGRASPARRGRAARRGPVVGILWGSWSARAPTAP